MAGLIFSASKIGKKASVQQGLKLKFKEGKAAGAGFLQGLVVFALLTAGTRVNRETAL